MSDPQLIAVGSQNPVKVEAALQGFQAMFPDRSFRAKGFATPSGVSDQPMSCEETFQGAHNRATRLKTLAPKADYWVGIEGGIEVIPTPASMTHSQDIMFANAWIVILTSAGQQAAGRSGSFALPTKVQDLVNSGVELGHANDQVFEQHNSKHSGGAVGSLTGGMVSRTDLYVHAMALTLVYLKQPELYC